MQIYLDLISENNRYSSLALILINHASWHTTEALNIIQNIRLMPLTPYAPELNPLKKAGMAIAKKN